MTSSRYRKQPDDLTEVIQKMQARLDKLEAGNRIGFTGFDNGTLTITNGTIVVKDSGGAEIVKFGNLGIIGSHVAWGLVVRRNDNTEALRVWSTPEGLSYTAFFDQSGNIVVSDDSLSQQGVATPWLNVPFGAGADPANTRPYATNDATAYHDLVEAYFPKVQPYLTVYYSCSVSAGVTSGADVQLVADGDDGDVLLAGPTHFAANTWSTGNIFGPIPIDGAFKEIKHWRIQGKLASNGGGSLYVGVSGAGAWGQQS